MNPKGRIHILILYPLYEHLITFYGLFISIYEHLVSLYEHVITFYEAHDKKKDLKYSAVFKGPS